MILPGLATGARKFTSDKGTRTLVWDNSSILARTSSKCWITQSDCGYGQVGFVTAANASVTSTTSSSTATPILLSLNRQSFMEQVLQGKAVCSAAEFAQEPELFVHGEIRVTE